MDRGDVFAFETENEKYLDWKYFRVIHISEEENKGNDDVEEQIGAKMYLIGNVLDLDDKVKKSQKFFIKDFLEMYTKEEVRIADEADTAVLFLTNKNF